MKRRAGAVTVAADIWHLDIPEFLEMRSEAGDQRRKAYDVFPQVVVTDNFMRRVEQGAAWTLVDPYEVKQVLGIDLHNLWGTEFDAAYEQIEEAVGLGELTLTQTVNARNLFIDILETQVETGLPYIAFKDAINRANPNKHIGIIPSVNLCCESFSVVVPGKLAHSCNLASVNLAQVEDDELAEICQLVVRLLDNTIDVTTAPIGEARNHNRNLRTIGVGVLGLADYLAKRGLRYQDKREIRELFKEFSYQCLMGSVLLAKERGSYPAINSSEYGMLEILGKSRSQRPEWKALYDLFDFYGIRNSHVMAIAPNTSSSLIQGCTASVLPPYALFNAESLGKGDVMKAVPFLREYGDNYQENQRLEQRIVVDAIAEMQNWVDTGISMELVFNLNPDVYALNKTVYASDIYDTALRAWRRGLKAIYYIRTVKEDRLSEVDGCGDSCTL
ncbi:ribonucleoside-diphosphate reductase subunit alpha [Crocosphaera subtropica]|uniref:ribonucleoside-diphosphate reductase subunit alpha n=1 Tax=Crocosphaera subtropica TaxID=2546360 RepID=UPI000A00A966|nr:ribonucleoside-diphosphate reductase subunit alpha [Crocosphaera subtropica]